MLKGLSGGGKTPATNAPSAPGAAGKTPATQQKGRGYSEALERFQNVLDQNYGQDTEPDGFYGPKTHNGFVNLRKILERKDPLSGAEQQIQAGLNNEAFDQLVRTQAEIPPNARDMAMRVVELYNARASAPSQLSPTSRRVFEVKLDDGSTFPVADFVMLLPNAKTLATGLTTETGAWRNANDVTPQNLRQIVIALMSIFTFLRTYGLMSQDDPYTVLQEGKGNEFVAAMRKVRAGLDNVNKERGAEVLTQQQLETFSSFEGFVVRLMSALRAYRASGAESESAGRRHIVDFFNPAVPANKTFSNNSRLQAVWNLVGSDADKRSKFVSWIFSNPRLADAARQTITQDGQVFTDAGKLAELTSAIAKEIAAAPDAVANAIKSAAATPDMQKQAAGLFSSVFAKLFADKDEQNDELRNTVAGIADAMGTNVAQLGAQFDKVVNHDVIDAAMAKLATSSIDDLTKTADDISDLNVQPDENYGVDVKKDPYKSTPELHQERMRAKRNLAEGDWRLVGIPRLLRDTKLAWGLDAAHLTSIDKFMIVSRWGGRIVGTVLKFALVAGILGALGYAGKKIYDTVHAPKSAPSATAPAGKTEVVAPSAPKAGDVAVAPTKPTNILEREIDRAFE